MQREEKKNIVEMERFVENKGGEGEKNENNFICQKTSIHYWLD